VVSVTVRSITDISVSMLIKRQRRTHCRMRRRQRVQFVQVL